MKKNINEKKIWILFGGESPEHYISILSAENVCLAIDKNKYKLKPVWVSKNGLWHVPVFYFDNKTEPSYIKEIFEKYKKDQIAIGGLPDYDVLDAARLMINDKIDSVFIAFHGEKGEDGVIQAFLESLKIKYTGSGVMASAVGMNKVITQKLLSADKLTVAKNISFSKIDFLSNRKSKILSGIVNKIKLPCVVKPSTLGSSIGISIIDKKDQLDKAISDAMNFCDEIMVEEFIKGVEVTCGVLEKKKENGEIETFALPPTEIVPKKNRFFDYESKYDSAMTDEITPARLPENTLSKIKKIAINVFKTIGCSGFARVDMIVSDKKIYVVEINTIPGMTENSLLPKGAKAIGISFSELIDLLAQSAYLRD